MRAHVFEVGVAHVVDGEDVEVGVLGHACLDVGEGFDRELFAFLGHFGEMHDFGALGSGHCAEFGGVLVVVESGRDGIFRRLTFCVSA